MPNDSLLIPTAFVAEEHGAVANGTVRVILTHADQIAISGFWVYGGEPPQLGQLVTVESALGLGRRQSQVWRIVPGEPYLIFATKLEP